MDIPKKLVIFDFDGTIADTLMISLDIVKEMLGKKRNFEPGDYLSEIRNEDPFELMKKNGVTTLKLYWNLWKIKQRLTKKMKEVEIFHGLREELWKLHKAGYRLGILSSNSKKNIELFINNHGLDVFDFIYSETNLFGKDAKLEYIIKKYNLEKRDVIYVGDEVRDIEAAKKVGVTSVAVCWGFNSEKLLMGAHPNMILENPKLLLRAIKNL